ncbi:hypothetical protein BJ742DRAFT_786111 [Cladochytrium replicatum]|nr:hypothetical protein BJ742DRAFT_786111 [Cladochytrium replicatum]
MHALFQSTTSNHEVDSREVSKTFVRVIHKVFEVASVFNLDVIGGFGLCMIVTSVWTFTTWSMSGIVYLLILYHFYHAIRFFSSQSRRKFYHYIQLVAASAIVLYHPIFPIYSSILFPEPIEQQYQPFPGMLIYPTQFITVSIITVATCNRILLFVNREKWMVMIACALIVAQFLSAVVTFVWFVYGGDPEGVVWSSISAVAYICQMVFEVTGMSIIIRGLLVTRRVSTRSIVPIAIPLFTSRKPDGASPLKFPEPSPLKSGENAHPESIVLTRNKIAPISVAPALTMLEAPGSSSIGNNYDFTLKKVSYAPPVAEFIAKMETGESTLGKLQTVWSILVGNSKDEYSAFLLKAKLLIVCEILIDTFGVVSWLCSLNSTCASSPEEYFFLAVLSDATIGLECVVSFAFLNNATTAFSLSSRRRLTTLSRS